jgi:hypothetical protein
MPQSFWVFYFVFWDRVSLTLPGLALDSWSFCLYLQSSYSELFIEA